jgi:replication-associated recombination protein RarA
MNISERLFHTTILDGTVEDARAWVGEYFAREAIARAGNVDIDEREYETLSIEDARELKSRAGERAETPRYFILYTHSITRETQHALLKLLEEPTENVFLILSVPHAHNLLPTVRSRARIITLARREVASTLLSKNIPERLKLVTKLLKSHEKDETSALVRSSATALIQSLITEVRALPESPEKNVYLTDLMHATFMLSDRGASVKMILEYIVNTMPVMVK